jgi:NAD dependent epimerase/dehydratase family enzyme
MLLCDDFLGHLAEKWEAEAKGAGRGVRTIIFRFGLVLGRTAECLLVYYFFQAGARRGNR